MQHFVCFGIIWIEGKLHRRTHQQCCAHQDCDDPTGNGGGFGLCEVHTGSVVES